MKNLVKAPDKTIAAFKYMRNTFLRQRVVNMQDSKLLHEHFNKEKNQFVWKAFKSVANIFSAKIRKDNYRRPIHGLLMGYKHHGCNMSLKINFLNSHIGAGSKENGKKNHQDIVAIDICYQGRKMSLKLADYYQSVTREETSTVSNRQTDKYFHLDAFEYYSVILHRTVEHIKGDFDLS